LLKFSTPETEVATVNFSVPDDLKKAFNRAFAGENKGAVMAALVRHAVQERERRKRRALAIGALLELRRRIRPLTEARISRARRKARP
jgi:hypothetical protein